MKKFLKFLLSFFIFLFFFFIIFIIYIKSIIPDLKEKNFGKTKITFNSMAVPLIESEDFIDAFSYLGFCHSIYRRTQMEILKRFAAGRLSEVFGEKFLEIDKAMRLFNFSDLSKETYGKYPSKILKDYSKRVNETTFNIKMPFLSKFISLEFEKWEPSDTYLLLYLLIFDLNRNLKQELFFLKTAKEINPEVYFNLFHSSIGERCIKLEEVNLIKEIPKLKLLADFDEIHKFQHFGASNAIAIGKDFSKTNNPFLCIDPHLNKSFPPIWYLAKVKIKDKEICGATIPGIPAILTGHTDKIAWGFTSSLADIIDLKIIDSLNLKEFEKKEEIIKIKGKKECKIDVYKLKDDVLISEAKDGLPGILLKFSKDIASSPFDAFEKIYKANDLYSSVEGFVNLPIVLNCIAIDKEGNLGHIVSGRIPKRKGSSGFFPTKEIEWDGFINNYDLYLKYDKDFIVSANEKTNGALSKSWCAPYRYERLKEIILKEKLDFESLKEIQRDFYSKEAEKILKILLKYFPEGNLKKRFQKWDLYLNPNSEEAYLFEVFYYKLFENLLKDELGKYYLDYLKLTPQSYPALDEAIYSGDENPLWDVVNTKEKEKMEEIVIKTVKEIESKKIKKWGEVHKLKIGFPFFKEIFPYPGDLNTINMGGFMPEIDFKIVLLPSLRFIVEMKEKPECYFEIPGGQSEHFLDYYSKNFLDLFLK